MQQRRNDERVPAEQRRRSSPVRYFAAKYAVALSAAAVGAAASFASVSHAEPAPASTKGKAALHACPAHVPEALNPPADVTLQLALPANGVQIYACTAPKPGEAPAWTLEGPHATLGAGQSPELIHFAGPSWQALDGSVSKGAKLAAADAPDGKAVPWLLLSATPSGAGTLAHVTHIQRLETVGGKAPATGCDAGHVGQKVLVPYRASYYFYAPAAAGEHVKQCRSAAAH
jgi:hypothetical protein